MEDLSLHVLDIAENGLRAGATRVRIEITEDPATRVLRIVVADNGAGMDPEFAARAADPFVTTRTERRVGLGLPLFAQSARETGGGFALSSTPGVGTRTEAWFRMDHIDCRPLGDMAETLVTLIAGHPERDFVLLWRCGEESLEVDTADVRRDLDGVSIGEPAVLAYLKREIAQAIENLRAK